MIFLTGISRKKHKNIVQMIFAFSNRVGKDYKICESFVFEFLPDTLASVIKKEKLDDTDIKIYTWQLFNGLRYLSLHEIVHRDIKPLNVLIDHPLALLKIGDFGSAKIIRKMTKSTAYQVTRFYRPPELLLGSEYYNWTVDLWSAGCVLGEMLRGNVLFPGRHYKHQLKLIFLCLGSPTEEDVKLMKVPTRIQYNGRVVVGTGLGTLCPDADPGLLDLLGKVLVYRPGDRLYGRQLLTDPAFASILKPGGKRSNGQLISTVITPEDIKDVEDDTGSKTIQIAITREMKRKLDFSCDDLQRKPSKTKQRVVVIEKKSSLESRGTTETIQGTLPSSDQSVPVCQLLYSAADAS
ncbi:kinase domain protein [Cooperia oncophora]